MSEKRNLHCYDGVTTYRAGRVGRRGGQNAPGEKAYPRLAQGSKAPDFLVPIVTFDNGTPIVTREKLSVLWAKHYIMLCFVSNAGGATFRPWTIRIKDEVKAFTDNAVMPIFIISADPGSPIYFKKEFRYPFHIAADPSGDIIKAYGLPDGESLETWRQGKSPLSQACVIDREGTVRYWCSPFVLKEDYEYLFYRALLMRRPQNDRAVVRVEAQDRARESDPEEAKPEKGAQPKKN